MKRIPWGPDCPERYEVVEYCTTAQSDAHVTELEVVYVWHPWFGRRVAIESSMVRGGVSIYRCRLIDEKSRSRDVPQWMFETATCCLMEFSDEPRVSVAALRNLKIFVSERKRHFNDLDEVVLENRHFQSSTGDDDNFHATQANPESTEPVCPTSDCSEVGTSSNNDATNCHSKARGTDSTADHSVELFADGQLNTQPRKGVQ